MKKLITIEIILFCLSCTLVFASPVNIPSSLNRDMPKTKEEKEKTKLQEELKPSSWGFYPNGAYSDISVKVDYVDQRKLKSADSKINGEFYTAQLSIPVSFVGLWDYYAEIGISSGLKTKTNINNKDVEFDLKNGKTTIWSVGANWMPLRWPELSNLSVFCDANYRMVLTSEYDTIEVNSVQSSAFTYSKKPQWQEWQVAFGAAAKFSDWLVPYAGFKYSDVHILNNVRLNGVDYVLDKTGSKNKIGGFVGLSVAPKILGKSVSLDLQARFVDEQAYTGKITVHF